MINKKKIKGLRRIINKHDYVYHYVDDPKYAQCLKNLNVTEAYHVLIISKLKNDEDALDIDAVLIACFLQEWYPHVRFTVDFK